MHIFLVVGKIHIYGQKLWRVSEWSTPCQINGFYRKLDDICECYEIVLLKCRTSKNNEVTVSVVVQRHTHCYTTTTNQLRILFNFSAFRTILSNSLLLERYYQILYSQNDIIKYFLLLEQHYQILCFQNDIIKLSALRMNLSNLIRRQV